ncbi:MAG TPA: NIPSNAP family protein [Haliscomenobacter sp.]|uniref:NIPSNAP family protein n=1 Tax=Haliscomenobacter sp. TaxID=2717303 RepID=UPI002C6CD65D|nr:NIPSNAP family protein [Haliscomenobacter sp.]HOY17116.1 NIPSNAP family protein [Haliscomenobacter sp.]HPH17332.1 NIPSNAP family protein [Haliscomenobacter sp.]
MNYIKSLVQILGATLLLLLMSSTSTNYLAAKREYYEIKIYHITGKDQETRVDQFLQKAYLPALHRAGIKNIGVYKPIAKDTTAGKRIYVFIPLRKLEQLSTLPALLDKDATFQSEGADYLKTAWDKPAYVRIESIVLQAFKDMPFMALPKLNGPASERVYELRSYEGGSEQLYQKKVHMFNEGQEISIFTRLGFNAVFYAEVLSGRRMPNLMYMTSFDNIESRDEHWKSFGADPFWKKISALPEYQHTVSKANIYLLHPAAYSEI